MKFHICETELGWIGVVFTPAGLSATTLPHSLRDGALGEVLALGASEEAPENDLDGLANRLRRYARGEAVVFADALDFDGVSPFLRAVWEATRDIPHGQTVSYGGLAARGGGPRGAPAGGPAKGPHRPALLAARPRGGGGA